mgnify:CR=1 FL=1
MRRSFQRTLNANPCEAHTSSPTLRTWTVPRTNTLSPTATIDNNWYSLNLIDARNCRSVAMNCFLPTRRTAPVRSVQRSIPSQSQRIAAHERVRSFDDQLHNAWEPTISSTRTTEQFSAHVVSQRVLVAVEIRDSIVIQRKHFSYSGNVDGFFLHRPNPSTNPSKKQHTINHS